MNRTPAAPAPARNVICFDCAKRSRLHAFDRARYAQCPDHMHLERMCSNAEISAHKARVMRQERGARP